MSTSTVFVMLCVGAGLALAVTGLLARVRQREQALAEILDLPYGEHDVPVSAVTESHSPLVASTVDLAGRMVEQIDSKGSLAASLERARIPLRAGEYVVVSAGAAVILAALLVAITTQWLFGLLGAAVAVAGAAMLPRFRVERRRRAFENQLPDALGLIASSLSAGHTFLRAIQMMCEESEPPLSEEFARVVSETRLGDPVVDALDRMAQRLQIRDLQWVVQAIRIQQSVGGKLADLLHTLADFIRAREEVRREVKVLTAEGRMSAWVLTALPIVLVVAIQVLDPGYLKPMFQGWGLAVMAVTAGMVATGTAVIFRMVKIDV
jgi:tight adherence protein B